MPYPRKDVIGAYLAHVNHVIDVPRLDVTLDLGFSVLARRVVTVSIPGLCTGTHYKDAMHCLVILVGGKEIFVETSPESGSADIVTAAVYVERPDVGRLPFTVEHKLYSTPPLMAVAECMTWSAAHNFDAKLLRATLKSGDQ